ncbi:hypothetical protein C3729_12720 [Cloacibacterium normanense]|uniref:Signal peptidase n=1 Tax=Cloacibacterium normanense TaxID=237258 RepID=A0A2S7I1X9_9FLAO|nr:hypothetical protein [Cloacibacterium normanense]PPZ90591.1 hypothetical protein C3729_12720 [Cloacibacterium normanense]
MLKHILFIFYVTFSTIIFAQDDGVDPGFGYEGDGDAADAPNAPAAPISDLTYPLLITGIAASIYFAKKKQEKEQTQ